VITQAGVNTGGQRFVRICLALATAACLLPFAGKAIHMDDPLFVWAAHHIQTKWWDPYGFDVNWYGWIMPMHEVTKNPPLASGYLALVLALFGESEVCLHLAFLLPAIAVVLGTYELARYYCASPFLSALALVSMPAFLVSSTTLMCDVLMLAFWIWALVLWRRGLNDGRAGVLALAGLFVGLAALTKYFGVALVPLLVAYSIARKERTWRWLPWLLIPVVLAVLYEWVTQLSYGHGLLSEAFGYTTEHEARTFGAFARKALTGLGFTGGCCATVLLCGPSLARLRVWIWGIAAALLLFLIGWIWRSENHASVGVGLQWTLFLLAGLAVLALPILEMKRQKNADALLLLLWVYGTFAFCLLNWTINARSLLPLAPAAAVLLVSQAEKFGKFSLRGLSLGVTAGIALSLIVAFADYRLAESARTAVKEITQRVEPTAKGAIWFQGHWGFQYYAQAGGWRPFDSKQPHPQSDDLIVLPVNNTNLHAIVPESVERLFTTEIPVVPWVATMSSAVDAGFYSDQRGRLPFAFGVVPAEKYYILRFK
jgi:4-amino-4-deoxy-L-arabinose transferase-like glycosyltransferase